MPAPILRSDVLDMKDLKPGMILKGTVRNVIDFGVFVDIGVHQDGLVHISQITDRYIKHRWRQSAWAISWMCRCSPWTCRRSESG